MAEPLRATRSDQKPFRFQACIADEVTRETVNRMVSGQRWSNAQVVEGSARAAVSMLRAATPPDLLLVDLSDSEDALAAMDELAMARQGETRILVIGGVNDVGLYRDLTGMGAADYLVKPISGEVLLEAVQRAAKPPSSDKAGRARIAAFIGARGGVGATTLAIATGWSLAHDHGQRVALLDLDLHFGNLALSLDLEPGRGLREALEHPERIDSLLINTAMSGNDERMRVLAAEEALEDSFHFDASSIEPLIGAISPDFDNVVVDLPRQLDDLGRHAISEADKIFLVTDLSLAAMRDTTRLLNLVKMIKSDADLAIVANHVGAAHRGEIGRREFEKGIGTSIGHFIPFDPKAATLMAQSGRPLSAISRTGKASLACRKLAESVSGKGAEKPRSLLRKLIG